MHVTCIVLFVPVYPEWPGYVLSFVPPNVMKNLYLCFDMLLCVHVCLHACIHACEHVCMHAQCKQQEGSYHGHVQWGLLCACRGICFIGC